MSFNVINWFGLWPKQIGFTKLHDQNQTVQKSGSWPEGVEGKKRSNNLTTAHHERMGNVSKKILEIGLYSTFCHSVQGKLNNNY